jgi:hypothetical protein
MVVAILLMMLRDRGGGVIVPMQRHRAARPLGGWSGRNRTEYGYALLVKEVVRAKRCHER